MPRPIGRSSDWRWRREDDVLLVNLVSAPDVGAPVTHTFNPFSSATADAIAQMIMSGVDQNMDTVSKSRAMLLLSGVTRALVWERDQGLIEVNVGTIKQAMRLSRLVEYVSTDRMPSVPTHIRAVILDYLSCLSGFMLEKGGRQANSTFEHHNHILTQLLPMLSVLSNVHGHVFLTPDVDVDMRDVVLNRRILVVMMPPVERSIGSQAAVARALEGALRSVANDMISGNTPGCWAATCDRGNAGVAPFTVVFERGDAEYARGCADIARRANLLNMQFVYGFGLSEHDSGPQLSGDFDGSRIIARSHRAARIEESGCTVGDISLAHLNRRLNETPGAYLPVLRQA
jgi:intracellular multiplication protein IcmO